MLGPLTETDWGAAGIWGMHSPLSVLMLLIHLAQSSIEGSTF